MTWLAFVLSAGYGLDHSGADPVAWWVDYAAAAFIALELVAFHFGVS